MGKSKGKGKQKAVRNEKQPLSLTILNENSITNQEQTDAFSKFPAEILLEVVSRLPPKDICNIRSVSKGINNLTRRPDFAAKHFRNCKTLSGNLTGFFCQIFSTPRVWRHNESRFINGQVIHDPEFVAIKSEADRVPDSLFNFLKKGNNSNDMVELIDSCNGLLLCCTHTGIESFKTWFVYNPLTMEHVTLPYPVKRSNLVYYGLLADTTNSGYLQYKVICIFNPKDDDSCSMLSVFSSKTGEWKEFEESLPPLCHHTMMGSKVVYNSKLFWDCLEGHILVCHLNKEGKSELIETPRAPLGRSLWKSNDKLFCYCQGFDDETPVWSLSINDEEELEWKVEGCEEFEMLTEDLGNELDSSLHKVWVQKKPNIEFNIIGFNPESKEIYLWKPDPHNFIIRYEFTERNFEIPWGAGRGPIRILPYVHSFAPIQMKEGEGKHSVDVETNKKKTKGKHVAPRSHRTN